MTDDQLPQKTFEIDGDIREELREWAHEPHMDEVYMSRLITAVEEIDALRSQLEQIREEIEHSKGMACSTVEILLCDRFLTVLTGTK